MTAQRAAQFILLMLALAALTSVALPETPASKQPSSDKAIPSEERQAGKPVLPELRKELITGQAVLLSDALKRRKIRVYAEETKGQVVLETVAGELIPLIPDWRGRALFQDERLRNRKLTLLVHRRAALPHVQVLSIFTYDEAGHSQLTDYWCDICSIPMYEIKKCDCCQGPTRLRFQKKELPRLDDAK